MASPSWIRTLIQSMLTMLMLAMAACADRSEPEPVEQNVRPARIFVVEGSATSLTYEFVGRVEPAQSVDMTFEVSGPLEQLPVLEGQSISKNELVAALESKDFELAVREAQVQLQLAKQDLERKKQVLEQKGIARSVVEDAQSNYQLQQVRLEKARESLADATLRAPFDAYVTRRYVDNFVNVRAGEKVVRLNDLHQLLVIANVPEGLLATVTTEQLIDVHAEFDFAPNETFPLTPYENRGEADNLAQTYEVSLRMARPTDWNILPGMTANVVVQIRDPDAGQTSVRIPSSALVGAADNSFYVWVYDPQTSGVSRREVVVGTPQVDGVPIKSGLTGGEMVVSTGAHQLSAGMKIRVLGEPSSRR